MIPPTSIDGTDITGATIDGTDVQEITVDGDVVFSAAPPIPSSVISHWEFEDEGTTSTAVDSESNNDLSIVGGPTYSTDSAVGNHAMEFTGGTNSGDRLEVSNSDGDFDHGTGTFAVSIWVKFDDVTQGTLFEVYQSDSNLYRVFNSNDSNWSWDTIGLASGNISYNFPTNQYEHYVFQRNASNEIELYVDSVFEETITTDSTNLDIGGEYYLGYDPKGSTGWGLLGTIDDVFHFDSDLTQQEIDDLYARGSP